MKKASHAVMPDPNFEARGTDPGLFAMVVTIGITIFAFIFVLFVSTVE